MTQAIKISAESLKSFQHDKNVVENLPEPPAIIVEQEDGTMKGFSKQDIKIAGYQIDHFSALLKRHGYGYSNETFEMLQQIHPKEFSALVDAYEKLYDAQMKIEN